MAFKKYLSVSGASIWPIVLPALKQVKQTLCSSLFLVLSLFFLILFGRELQADHPEGVPQEVLQHIKNPQLNGHGNLYVFVFHIYDGALWVENPPWNFNQKFALTLFYQRDISKKEFIDTSIEELRRYYSDIDEKEQGYRSQLHDILVDVIEGDRIAAIYIPNEGLIFYHNGIKKGIIQDDEFAKRYINIWLHPNAHYQGFKKKLIGPS